MPVYYMLICPSQSVQFLQPFSSAIEDSFKGIPCQPSLFYQMLVMEVFRHLHNPYLMPPPSEYFCYPFGGRFGGFLLTVKTRMEDKF